MPYTVKAAGICKSFGGPPVLDHVDLAIEQGTVLGLLGPNGAGKTTLVRILATILRPDAGAAVVAGHDLMGDPNGVKRSISLTGQFAAVDDVLTGRENLQMMARLLRVPRRSTADVVAQLLHTFDLSESAERRAGTYSGGMRRRLDLAISMITKPALLFLDEPTTGLDPRSRDQVWATVRGLVDDGVTVLLTTQYLDEADQLADNIALLDEGRIVAQGSADQLKANFGVEVLRLRFASREALRKAAALLEVTQVDEGDCALEVATDGSAACVRSTLSALEVAGAPALKVSIHRPSLDDVFLSLTTRS
jgi:ABC-2 type transport system ATP-binding protein